jgi:ubiquitin thioesterase ZRANB1
MGKKIKVETISFCCRFFSRWKEAELRQSHAQGFSLDEEQFRQDWAAVVALADQTGKSLEQIHIFVLSHILRRPVLVYGVKVVKNFRGENLGFVNFEGLCKLLVTSCVFSFVS